MTGGLRAAGCGSAFQDIPATYSGKMVLYAVPMLASVISSSIFKEMFEETKTPETFKTDELNKIWSVIFEYITATSTELDFIAKNIATATVAATATPKTRR